MSVRGAWMTVLMLALCACGSSRSDGEASSTESRAPQAATESAAESGRKFDRDSFVLCPALESHRDELAEIVGFEQDAGRPIGMSESECSIEGEFGAFARVVLVPAFEPSIEFHVSGMDAEASSLPQLGQNAVFVDVNLQPHVVFSMGSLIIDVDASNVETPSRGTMIELASRVREILRNTNG